MAEFGWINTTVLAVYLMAMVAIGIKLAGRQKSGEDYFLAGRNLPWLAVGMSMFASLTSATTYMGVPAFAYQHNTAMIFGVVTSLVVAPLLVRWFYPVYRRQRITTSYEYIQQRYGPYARCVVSLLFILSRLGWLGIVIYAPAKAMSVASGISLSWAVVLIGLLAVTYTVLGGLSAVIWTDVVQFVILLSGAVWLAVTLITKVPGGFVAIMAMAKQSGKFAVWDVTDWAHLTALSAMTGWFFVFLYDYGTDQVTVQRLLAVRTDRGVAKAIGFNAVNDVLINGLLIFIGIGMAVYFQVFPDRLAPDIHGDGILPYFIMHTLPPGISGLLVTAVFAAAMSSMDSGINSLATVIINDFVRPWRDKRAGRVHEIALARLLTAILGGLATLAALMAARIGGIVELWMKVMGLFAAPILSIFVLGLLSRRACFSGWLAGALCGIGLTVYLQQEQADRLMAIWHFPLSFVTTTAVGYSVSLMVAMRASKRPAPCGDRP